MDIEAKAHGSRVVVDEISPAQKRSSLSKMFRLKSLSGINEIPSASTVEAESTSKFRKSSTLMRFLNKKPAEVEEHPKLEKKNSFLMRTVPWLGRRMSKMNLQRGNDSEAQTVEVKNENLDQIHEVVISSSEVKN